MRVRWRNRVAKVSLAAASVLLAGGAWIAVSEIREARAFAFEKVSVPGVANVGRITPRLLRGGQPDEQGLQALRGLGVDTVVSFTLEGEGAEAERRQAESLGMRYVHLPWSASANPPPGFVRRFLELASDRSHVVFAHCKAGADRTGVMIAAYRVAIDGWPVDAALDEMDAFGYEVEFHPQLRTFVSTFGQLGHTARMSD